MTPQDNISNARQGSSASRRRIEGITFDELLIYLRRGRWAIVGITFLVLALVALYTFLRRPVYEATAVMQIESSHMSGVTQVLDFTGSGISTKIANELEVLRSADMIEEVARGLITQRTRDNDSTHILNIILDQSVTADTPGIAPFPAVVKRLTGALEITPVRESDIIRLSVRSVDPEEAAFIANFYTRMYTDWNVNASRKKSHAMREFLQTQLADKHRQLEASERQLQDYMRRSKVVSLDNEARQRVEQMAQLESQRDAIDVDIKSRETSLTSLQDQLAKEEPNVARAMGESNDAYVRLLQEQIARLELQRDLVMTQTGQRSGEGEKADQNQLTGVEVQIAQLKKNLRERANKLVGTLVPSEQRSGTSEISGGFVASAKQRIIEQSIELDGLKAKKAALTGIIHDAEREFNKIPAKSIELAKLQRERLSTEKLYLLVEERFNEAAITETSEFGSVNVVAAATVPFEPVSPRPMLNMTIALFLGLVLGTGFVLIRASLDTRFRSPDDLKRIGITPLAVINTVEKDSEPAPAEATERSNGHPISPNVIAFHNPLAPASDMYRRLRDALQDIAAKKPFRTLIISSASPQEGKSTVAANLATTYAGSGEKVLLVDADFHSPTLHTLFGITREQGFSDVVLGKMNVDFAIHRNVVKNLDVLTRGSTVTNPGELLIPSKIAAFLSHVQSQYSLVVLDSPPLLAVADSGTLARSVDAIVLVVRSGVTTIEMLERACEFLNKYSQNLLGVVLNGFDAVKAYGGNGYAYKSGYSHYGYGANGKRHKSTTEHHVHNS